MRTTVTLDADVARLLNDQARRTRKSFKETLNATVRLGFRHAGGTPATAEFTIDARPLQLKAGLDAGHFNSLLDELETAAFIDQSRPATRRKKARA